MPQVLDVMSVRRVLPLQFASLLIVTLPLTLPRLLALQLANPASVVEGVPIVPILLWKVCLCWFKHATDHMHEKLSSAELWYIA